MRRGPRGKRSGATGVRSYVLVLALVLAVTAAVGLLWKVCQGRVRPTTGDLDLVAELGQQPGERATLLQFSSAFCAPCRATRRVLADVAAVVPGVRHVEVDAEQHLDLVRRMNVLKTPTTLVLDARGNVTQRAAGQPRKEQILAALERAVG